MGNNIKRLMDLANVNPIRISKLTGIARPNLYSLIRKEDLGTVQYNTLKIIADALDVDVKDLVGEDTRIYNNLYEQMTASGITTGEIFGRTGIDVAEYLELKDLRKIPYSDIRSLSSILHLEDEKMLYLPPKDENGVPIKRRPKRPNGTVGMTKEEKEEWEALKEGKQPE